MSAVRAEIGDLIVILVIYLFLGSVRAVIIPVVAIPISLVGAAFLMLAAGFKGTWETVEKVRKHYVILTAKA